MEDAIKLDIVSGTFPLRSMKATRFFIRINYEGSLLEFFVGDTKAKTKAQTAEYLRQLALAVAEAQCEVEKLPDDVQERNDSNSAPVSEMFSEEWPSKMAVKQTESEIDLLIRNMQEDLGSTTEPLADVFALVSVLKAVEQKAPLPTSLMGGFADVTEIMTAILEKVDAEVQLPPYLAGMVADAISYFRHPSSRASQIPVNAETVMADAIENEERLNPQASYSGKIPTINFMREIGTPDSMIEKLLGISLSPQVETDPEVAAKPDTQNTKCPPGRGYGRIT